MRKSSLARLKKSKRVYLKDTQTKDLKKLNELFEFKGGITRIRIGKRQIIETLINEEGLLLAKFLREESKIWVPRTPLIILRAVV